MIALATYVVALLLSPVALLAAHVRVPAAPGLAGLLALAAALVMVIASAALPELVFDHGRYLHDLWTAYDAAAKAGTGLASSTDYFSPIGPVYDWVFRAALLLRQQDATIVPLANGLFAGGLLVLGFLALRRQLSPLALGLVLLIAIATVVSPREPDQIFAQATMSWLAPYNRWAGGLTAVVTAALICPPGRRGLAEALLLGVLIALVALIKVTFGAALVGLLLVAVVLRSVSLSQALAALLALAATLILTELVTGQVTANLADLRFLAGFAGEPGRVIKLLSQLGEAGLWALGSTVFYLLLCDAGPVRRRIVPVLLVAVAAFMACVILMQNHWLSESPVYAILPVVALEWAAVFRPDLITGERSRVRDYSGGRILVLAGVALALLYPLRDGGALLTQWIQSVQYPADARLAGTGMAGFVLHPKWQDRDAEVGLAYARMLDGLDLLRAQGPDMAGDETAGSERTVLALNFANPFPALLKAPSPKVAPIWFHDGRTFSEKVHLPAEQLFSDAAFVMRALDDDNGEALWAIYGDAVETGYREVGRSAHWVLYRRRD